MSPPLDLIQSDERLPERVDVVVIGGGIVGVSAAYFLAQEGHSVALLEKGLVGAEQSSRNWGFVRQQGRDKAEIPLIKESLAIWSGLDRALGADVGFRRAGIAYFTEDPSVLPGWELWMSHAREYQIHSRLLSAAEAQSMAPGCTRKWIAGLYTESDGAAEPAKAAPAMAEGARRLGASIHQNCAVRGMETQAGRVSAVITERGPVRTDAVLCAAGAWSSLFCRRHGIDLPQLVGRASVVRTAPAPKLLDPNVSTSGFSVRRRLDGSYNVAISGRWTHDIVPDSFRYMRPFWPAFLQQRRKMKLRVGRRFFESWKLRPDWDFDAPSPFEAVRVWDPAPDRSTVDEAFGNFKAAFPAIADLPAVESWAGMIDITPDAVPVISPVPALPGFVLATGFSGHGFGLGPGAGRLAASLVAGKPPIVDPAPFRYERLATARIADETVSA
jgi:glycine/D-amino acid oxidase-like deaminating enzyme